MRVRRNSPCTPSSSPILCAGVLALSACAADDKTDATTPLDAAYTDLSPDSSELPDASLAERLSSDGDGARDAGVDSQPDVIASPPILCGDKPELPSWAEHSPADNRIVAHCEGEIVASLQAYERGIVRLRYANAPPLRASYAVVQPSPEKDVEMKVGSRGDEAMLCTREWTIAISRDRCRIHADSVDGTRLIDEPSGGGFFRDRAKPKPVTTNLTDPSAVEQDVIGVQRAISSDERFYGFGQRSGLSIDRRGTEMDNWNTDVFVESLGKELFRGYLDDQDPLYESIPFYIGMRDTKAYGVFNDNTFRQRFDVGKKDPQTLRMISFGGELDQYLIAGPSMRDVLRRYTWLTGRPFLPPRWSLGYHQCRWEWVGDCLSTDPTTNKDRVYCSADKVLGVGKTLRDLKIPADGLWLDIQHHDNARTFSWNETLFPNPQKLVADLGSMGFKLTVVSDPAIMVSPGDKKWSVYDEGIAGDFFLKRAGRVFSAWEAGWPRDANSVFPDFSASKVRAWWAGHTAQLVALGVRGIWNDMNEPSAMGLPERSVPNDTVIDGDGVPGTMSEFHNAYGLNEAKATFDGMTKANPARRPFILSRAAYAGQQRYSAVWTGDSPSRWNTLAATFPMMLGMGLSGVVFAGSDVGGYAGAGDDLTDALYARWMQVGSLSPFFRLHTETKGRRQEPWAWTTEVEEVTRQSVGLRYELLPYLYSLFAEAASSGAPILRPMVFEFQDDPMTHALSDQAMLGPWILAAPILKYGLATREVYLPAGRWYEFHSGKVYEGGQQITISTAPDWLPLAALPLFVRQGAIVPRADRMQYSDERPVEPLYLDVYPADQGSDFVLYEDDGDSYAFALGSYAETHYKTRLVSDGSIVESTGRKGSFLPQRSRVVVRIRRVDNNPSEVTIDGSALPRFKQLADLKTPGFYYDENDKALVASIADKPVFHLRAKYKTTELSADAPVRIPIRVRVPQSTPAGSAIHVAVSTAGWTHQPLSAPSADGWATGTIKVERGKWFFYKFTRGTWQSVEKQSDCGNFANRYAQASAKTAVDVTVTAWADHCP